MSQKSKELDDSIYELKQLKNVSFSQKTEELETVTSELNEKKEAYTSLVNVSSDSEINSSIQTDKYQVEYLWVKVGNHATKNGIILKMDVVKGTSSEKQKYNLQFTAKGTYAHIAELIYEIENDSTLGFKIENFKLLPTIIPKEDGKNSNNSSNSNNTNENENETTTIDVENLTATFTVKNVNIELDQLVADNTNSSNNTRNNTTNTTQEENDDINSTDDIDNIANSIQ